MLAFRSVMSALVELRCKEFLYELKTGQRAAYGRPRPAGTTGHRATGLTLTPVIPHAVADPPRRYGRGCQSGSRPEAGAALSRAGPVNLAAALRHHARDPARPLTTLGITCG